jgi:hypothetical protein
MSSLFKGQYMHWNEGNKNIRQVRRKWKLGSPKYEKSVKHYTESLLVVCDNACFKHIASSDRKIILRNAASIERTLTETHCFESRNAGIKHTASNHRNVIWQGIYFGKLAQVSPLLFPPTSFAVSTKPHIRYTV